MFEGMLMMSMAETESLSSSEQNSIQNDPNYKEAPGADGSGSAAESNSLSSAQQDVLERCLHALTHAKNDSHILAALLLVRSQKKLHSKFQQATLQKNFDF